ncbi:hypothetical protein CWRG_00355 [Chthonomonas calidirosea]|uniref:Uncharacterized protein n=1 Tax=Chthonomonas calidirosea (strain DSM 23976 / ICMP 18418 / T49) TaxID=1303518 RepID=S0EW45_CHTCT|nr:hypothetical protein [Chthonomonas calidirosea]CCW34617.1 hypothetical protein CCALI_00792 [Chthonomonas calidirosea T49]CEK13091.1 hypothetical protein CWRG_00355 [Chthonomonas calidirosea]CEK13098.1 hypothetical protein CP488_00359 [Chthonomonas calidirosea]CEK14272.1 hypothetical protein CTKA_00363 [Chthonomonas calidirosea]
MSNTEPNTSSQGLQEEPSALLPPIGRQLLILAWLLLFGGRWLIAPLLQINGLLTPQALAALDEGPLMKLYLVLFVICVTLAVWQWVRDLQPPTQPTREEETRG